ncbi:MAG: hypothetical protein M3Q55_05255, partial [Acidobacteriota bacterium]|nr:hypothetical protein [Acidobacteriota bacterium]
AGAGTPATNAPRTAVSTGAQTIDALFAPIPTVTTAARVWVVAGEASKPQLKAVRIRTGIADGQWTELVSGELQEGQSIVTGVVLANAAAQVPGTAGSNPLMGPQRGGGRGR